MKKRITDTTVQAAQPGEKDIYTWDAVVPGFGLKVTPTGSKSFLLQYKAQGRTRRLTIGPCHAWSTKDARSEAAKAKTEISRGVDPQAAKMKEKTFWTVAEALAHWLEYGREKWAERTVEEYIGSFENHVLPVVGRIKVRELTIADCERIKTRAKKGGRYAANRALGALSSMLSFCQRRDQLGAINPAKLVERYREESRERFLSAEELARLGEVMAEEATRAPISVGALRLLALTGMRSSEVSTLQWSAVDFEAGTINLTSFKGDQQSKRKVKVVHLSAPALEVLQTAESWRTNDYVFPSVYVTGKTHVIDLTAPWIRIRKAAGLDDVRIHDLRHGFASVAVSGGQSLPIIGKLLGHARTASTERYAHLAADPVKAAAEATGATIAAALGGKKGEVVSLKKGA